MKKGHIDILTILGGKPSKDGEDDMDSTDLALKAVFKAIKSDDFDGFKEGMEEWRMCCDEKTPESDEKSDDEDKDSNKY